MTGLSSFVYRIGYGILIRGIYHGSAITGFYNGLLIPGICYGILRGRSFIMSYRLGTPPLKADMGFFVVHGADTLDYVLSIYC